MSRPNPSAVDASFLDTARRYQITSVLGQGGFGTVYRATLVGAGGFTKDVAVKLLTDRDPPAEVLQRFRDEARVLGLVRDRAVVHVEPPVRLNDRWAVVMEYVDGAALSRVLRKHGPLPPAIALEITAEVARALHRLWHQPGAGGEPLHLRHRDLKPGNVQLTPDGSVVLLDFGIAKAVFDAREARTTSGVMGTEGYIAPERFYGTEGPTTDVFSLGVMLHEMVLGSRPPSPAVLPEGDDLGAAAVRLALRMAALDAVGRPEPRDVERQASELLRAAGATGQLREWAETAVPAASTLPHDALVGELLSESVSRAAPSEPTGGGGLALVLGGTGVLAGLAFGAAGLLLAVGIGLWAVSRGPAEPAPQPVAVAPAPEPPAPVAPPPVAPPPDAPAPEAPAPPSPTPAPVPAVAAPAAPRPVATWPLTFVSLPPDAEIRIDDVGLGKAPLSGVEVREGRRRVVLTLGDARIERTITVDARSPRRYVWRVATGAWEAGK